MLVHRGFRYALLPTGPQAESLRHFSGVCRLIYNLAYEQRRDWWRQYKANTGRNICWPSQSKELTELRAQYDWIAAVERVCQEQALRDLDRAFVAFFKGKAKFPHPRRKGVNDSFRFIGSTVPIKKLNSKWSAARLPKIGWVKFRDTRPCSGTVKAVTISLEAGRWHIAFSNEIEIAVVASAMPTVGIDRGIINTLALSTGENVSLPNSLIALERRKRRAQRELSRKRIGSKRRSRALRRVSRLAARMKCVRKDWHHKAALNLAQRFGVVVLEDLKVRNMTASASGTVESPGRNVPQKSGLNRAILNQGWFAFETILAYKLEERGGSMFKVDPAYTSQTCSDCGVIDKGSRESQASFNCLHCGFRANADHNAAINILRRNTSVTRTEGSIFGPVEVRTGGGLPVENRVAKAA